MGTRRLLRLRHLEGRTQLAEHFCLADHGRIETRANGEKVPGHGVVVGGEQMRGEPLDRQAGAVSEEPVELPERSVKGFAHGIDLGAVAGRNNDRFGDVVAATDLGQRLDQTGRRNRHPLQHLDRGGAMMQPNNNEGHG